MDDLDERPGSLVELYDKLLERQSSPVVALNRAIAIAQWKGAETGLDEIGKIEGGDRLSDYVFYAAALGELELRCGRREAARGHFLRAVGLARNIVERRFLEKRVEACGRDLG
ncbi:MAG TPA: hypothetical protein VIM11_11150 [Tepidisphaeraceae bacterium]|jgi:RNA polymerase sigma-70 factor (ECF subfamily)